MNWAAYSGLRCKAEHGPCAEKRAEPPSACSREGGRSLEERSRREAGNGERLRPLSSAPVKDFLAAHDIDVVEDDVQRVDTPPRTAEAA